ncbi:MAG: hypothetical protein GDA56_21885 [Hormoscilla sp. GM7CHS1pb]|nr:hypothetical protein [Hormoscilla sp. GM7CHS1pb]
MDLWPGGYVIRSGRNIFEGQGQANPSLGIDLEALPVLNQILKHRSSAGAEFDSQGQGTLVIEL